MTHLCGSPPGSSADGSLNGDREEYQNPVWSEDELPPAHP